MDERRSEAFREAIRAEVDAYMRGPSLRQSLGRGNASALAQQTAEGIGIDQVRRMVASTVLTDQGAALTVAFGGADYEPLSTPLSLDVMLSGRPVLIVLSGIFSAVGGVLRVGARLRGDFVLLGGSYTGDNPSSFTATGLVTAPAAGRATIDIVAIASTADGTIFVDAENALQLIAMEL